MNRKEIISVLANKCTRYALRGNVLWAIENGEIICYELFNSKDGWSYNTYSETNYPPYLSCPLYLLNDCPHIKNEKWRNDVVENFNKQTKIKNEIEQTIDSTDESYVTIQSKKGFSFPREIINRYFKDEIEISWEEFNQITTPEEKNKLSVTAMLKLEKVQYNILVGRAKNNRLYKIPKRMIKEIKKGTYHDN